MTPADPPPTPQSGIHLIFWKEEVEFCAINPFL